MLDAALPPPPPPLEQEEDEHSAHQHRQQQQQAALVPSPTSIHHASRSSTPGISSLDGTPRYLYATPLLTPSAPPAPSDSPFPLEMAMKPGHVPHQEHQLQQDKVTVTEAPDQHQLQPEKEFTVAASDEHHQIQPGKATAVEAPNGPGRPLPHTRLGRTFPEASPTRTAIPDDARDQVPPLAELGRLLRVQRLQKRRSHHAEEHLHYLLIAAARTSRLVSAARSVQHTLAECIRCEDKPSFVNLLHAFQDACEIGLRPTSAAIVEADVGPATHFEPTTPFLEELSSSSRACILSLFGKIRNDGEFLANELASLTPKELLALLPDRSVPRSNESVLGGHSRAYSRTSKPLGFVVDAQVDDLLSCAYSSPLDALAFAVRGLAKSGTCGNDRATDVWATVCAKLLSEQKPGSERLVPAVLDIWTASYPWPGKSRLEIWILKTLQHGAFLLDQSSKQTFRARMEGRSDVSAEEELRAEKFYSQAADSLLSLLGETSGSSVLPPGALRMCHRLIDKLVDTPGHQQTLPQFVVTRWLFHTFIMDVVTLPEAYGMLTDHYVSEIARQRILREVATRAQKAVFDVAYLWRYGNFTPPGTSRHVAAVMAQFRAPIPTPVSAGRHATMHDGLADRSIEEFLAITPKDVLLCINALYPPRRPASVASDGDNMASGLLSSSSSVSGFSLFQNPKLSEALPSHLGSFPRDSHSLSVGEIAEVDHSAANMIRSFDHAQMRDVCLELEDLIGSQPSNSNDMWDVLCTTPHESDELRTMRETKSAAISTKESRGHSLGKSFEASKEESQSRDFTLCVRAVETLLREHGIPDHCNPSGKETAISGSVQDAEAMVERIFESAIQDSELDSDFVQAHYWYQQLETLQCYLSDSANCSPLVDVLSEIERTASRSTERARSLNDACDRWAHSLQTRSQLRFEQLNPVLAEHERLRDKLWYVTDVRTSAAYDDARSVATALRVMGIKRIPRTRIQPPLRHWNGPKLSSTGLHLKTEAQVLEILSAKPDHGGPNKLSDEQSKVTELWMDRQNIDNICKGEERIHKLCMEVRKCAESIMNAPTESSTIWSNPLFARDVAFREQTATPKNTTSLSGLHSGIGQHSFLSFPTQVRSNDALSATSKTLSSISSRDMQDLRSPTLTNKSSIPFWSPAMTEVDSPSSATSIGSSRTQSALLSSYGKQQISGAAKVRSNSLDTLRQRVTGLLLSDLASSLFSEGSETDVAFLAGLGWSLTDKYLCSLHALSVRLGSETPIWTSCHAPRLEKIQFSFELAFSTLLQKFSVTSNPSTKLQCLYDIERLLVPYMARRVSEGPRKTSSARGTDESIRPTTSQRIDATEDSVKGFRDLFTRHTSRPLTIFRDLQYIAALLPSSTLQNTPEGKSFCNAAVAVAGLKQEARSVMVETADSIIAYHSNNRGHGRSPSLAQQKRDSATFSTPSRTPSAEDVSRYGMADAAYLLQITAKEGDAVAQRELATLYLTHPELMEPIIAPFASPRDVFKDELESKWRKNQDVNRCDPATMCVAHHWMSLSSKGGDSLAQEYLRQREEMDSF